MVEKSRIQQIPLGKVQEEPVRPLFGEGEQSPWPEGVAALQVTLDEILSSYLMPGATEIIGGEVKRPSLRSTSEEYVRAFRQQTGQ